MSPRLSSLIFSVEVYERGHRSRCPLSACHFFDRCDSALAAADFAAFEVFGLRRTSDAFDAARALVTSFADLNCVRALAAADFCALVELELERILLACEAAFLPVSRDIAACCVSGAPIYHPSEVRPHAYVRPRVNPMTCLQRGSYGREEMQSVWRGRILSSLLGDWQWWEHRLQEGVHFVQGLW